MKRYFQNRTRFFFLLLILIACVSLFYFASDAKKENALDVKSEPARLRAQKKKCACCKKIKAFRKEFEARQAQRKLEAEKVSQRSVGTKDNTSKEK